MANLTEVKTSQFDEVVLRSKEPVIVDFWATWCGPCKALAPKLDELAAELGALSTIVKVNIEESPELAQRYAVRGVPALLFFKDGAAKKMLVGNQPKTAIA